MTRRILLAVAIALGACRGGLGHPQLSYKVSAGNALAPPGTSRGTTSTIAYADHGGILTRIALAIPRFLNAPDGPTRFSECSGSGVSLVGCTSWTTQEELDKYAERVKPWLNNIMTGQSSATTTLEYSSDTLGGDTKGLRLDVEYPIVAEGRVLLKAGVALGAYTFRGRTTRFLSADATSVHVDEMTGDVKSSLVSVPIKILFALPAGVVASYQLEWNLQRLWSIGDRPGETYHPSLSRLRVEAMVAPVVRVGAGLEIDGLGFRSTTVSAEVGLAF